METEYMHIEITAKYANTQSNSIMAKITQRNTPHTEKVCVHMCVYIYKVYLYMNITYNKYMKW